MAPLDPAIAHEMLLNMAAMPHPPGVKPDFVSPSTFRPEMLGVLISMFIIATIAVMVRTYTKLVIVKRLAMEDCKYCSDLNVRRLTELVDLIICAWVHATSLHPCISADATLYSLPTQLAIRPSATYCLTREGQGFTNGTSRSAI
jgi:hypothetical protein